MPTEPITISVSELNYRVKNHLEATFGRISVRGEISNLSKARSGHCYFTLKDQNAEISCVFFKRYGDSGNGLAHLQVGSACCVDAQITLYPQRGQYQLLVLAIRADGTGLLQQAYQKLRAQLQQEGLFDPETKQQLPSYPKTIGIISSLESAGLQDLTTTLATRYPLAKLCIISACVQGEQAPASLRQALRYALSMTALDVIVFCRGGGSFEDLHCFNDEALARAIYACAKPTLSAIGHETDWTICDSVCDLRAATPTQAAILLSPDIKALSAALHTLTGRCLRAAKLVLQQQKWRTQQLHARLRHPREHLKAQTQLILQLRQRLHHSTLRYLSQQQQRLDYIRPQVLVTHATQQIRQQQQCLLRLQTKLHEQFRLLVLSHNHRLQLCIRRLMALSPEQVLARGYVLVESKNQPIGSVHAVKNDDIITLCWHDGSRKAAILPPTAE